MTMRNTMTPVTRPACLSGLRIPRRSARVAIIEIITVRARITIKAVMQLYVRTNVRFLKLASSFTEPKTTRRLSANDNHMAKIAPRGSDAAKFLQILSPTGKTL
jgi:hypothetical protein